MRKNDNKHRNRTATIKLNLHCPISYKRFKFRENRVGVFNNERTIIKLTYALNNDNN
jgi:hypothetical protein